MNRRGAKSVSRNPGLAVRVVASAFILSSLFYAQSTHARFKLIKQWTVQDGEPLDVPVPGQAFADGSMYLWDTSGFTPYPIWRLQASTLTPVSGFTPTEGTFERESTFPVGELTIMYGRDNGVQKHWRIEGNDVIPLEAEFGPIPFADEWLWTPLDASTIISGRDDSYGRELWRMDDSGYELISDLNAGPQNSHPGDDWFAVRIGETAAGYLFSLDNGETGAEPWVYNSDEETLTILGDLIPGAKGSSPAIIGTLGSTHYFGTTDNKVYKISGANVESIVDDTDIYYYVSPFSGSHFEYMDQLYAWWPVHGFGHPGFVLRISADDTVQRFEPEGPGGESVELYSVAPFDGAIQIVGKQNGPEFPFLKIIGDDVLPSDLFSEQVTAPKMLTWTEDELLFQDTPGFSYVGDLYCIIDGQTIPVWQVSDSIGEYSAIPVVRDNWVYVKMRDDRAAQGLKGGIVQLWGMPWPAGCHEPWVEDLVIETGFE